MYIIHKKYFAAISCCAAGSYETWRIVQIGFLDGFCPKTRFPALYMEALFFCGLRASGRRPYGCRPRRPSPACKGRRQDLTSS